MDQMHTDPYDIRLKRIMDAVRGGVPDKVPALVDFGYFAAKYGGITVQDAFYDVNKWISAYKKTVIDFHPDAFYGLMFFPGAAYEAVGTKVVKWPGHGVGPDQSMQAVESELMKADEYEEFLDDPSDFIIRKILPRGAANLVPLQMLPPLSMCIGFISGFILGGVTLQSVVAACEAIYKAGKISEDWFLGARLGMIKELEDLGFPAVYQAAIAGSGYETMANSLRGMKGAMLDMYRQPDKLLEAIRRLSKITLRTASIFKPMGRNTLCFSAALRGADGFMSKEQFLRFYWPSMKEAMNMVIENGYTPCILWEGDFTSRLEYIAELPEGKVIHRFDKTDPIRAREVLGPSHCIAGGISASLLATGTVDDVKERCKKTHRRRRKERRLHHEPQLPDGRPQARKHEGNDRLHS